MDGGRALREARQAAGISQRELAVRAGMPQSTVARIESGVVSPRLDTFERLLGLCGFRLALSMLGEGIDRTVMRELIKLTPDQLLDLAAAEAHNLEELLASVRR
jgi:transcriptional regulator with XRE-family HTH domain